MRVEILLGAPTQPRWQCLGLYAVAGECVTVHFDDALPSDVALQVGPHNDSLNHLSDWKRAPNITMRVALRDALVDRVERGVVAGVFDGQSHLSRTVCSPFGGLVGLFCLIFLFYFLFCSF